MNPPDQNPDVAAALARLVQRGVLDAEQASAVAAELRTLPADGALPGLRRRFAEIAGYLGGAFVIGAAFLFLGQQWEALGRFGRFGVLAGMAVVLFACGLFILTRGGRPLDDVRRRLASTLMTGAAGTAGFAAQVILAPSAGEGVEHANAFDLAVLGGGGVALLVVVGGYLLARSAAGQLGAALAALWVIFALLEVFDAQTSQPFGLGTLLLGVGWLGLVWARLLTERRFGLAVAVTLGLAGTQFAIVGGSGSNYLGYALTALVAGACFAGYTRVREWVLLAGGVVGATLVVPEFLYDVTDGSLGASGVMLAAGVTLLGASLAGMRIRQQEVGDGGGPAPADAPSGTA